MRPHNLHWTPILESIYLSATEAEEALFRHLFEKNYNKWIRPVEDLNEIISVYLKLTVRQLLEVDEKNQLMHTNVWLKTVIANMLLSHTNH